MATIMRESEVSFKLVQHHKWHALAHQDIRNCFLPSRCLCEYGHRPISHNQSCSSLPWVWRSYGCFCGQLLFKTLSLPRVTLHFMSLLHTCGINKCPLTIHLTYSIVFLMRFFFCFIQSLKVFNGKSLVGSAGCMFICLVVCSVYLSLVSIPLSTYTGMAPTYHALFSSYLSDDVIYVYVYMCLWCCFNEQHLKLSVSLL